MPSGRWSMQYGRLSRRTSSGADPLSCPPLDGWCRSLARRAYNDGPYSSYHEGLDIANLRGTPVVATGRGRVVLAQDDLIVRGGAVILDHGLGIHTGYWHMDKVLAKVDTIVEQGDVIGLMGTKGFSTAPHVHWDLRIGALNVSPLEWTEQDWGKSIEQQ
jgi:murein DD-endopeptidase MepM/ murein hydrolase activator NlpD